MSTFSANPPQLILGVILILSSLGVLLARQPVHASLSFLLTLITLSALYLQLSAQFIAIMQVLVYAGAILVIFMFVIVLFQDAHQQIEKYQPKSAPLLLFVAAVGFVLTLAVFGKKLLGLQALSSLPTNFGTAESLGQALYVDYFFPFEAVIMLFLVAIIGALYVGRKVK